MVGNPKMDPPHIKTSCGTQNKNSNPMGIGLGIDDVTWWEILKWIPPTSLVLELSMDPGTCRALGVMYRQLRQAFKIAGALGLWWHATNGILHGCPL